MQCCAGLRCMGSDIAVQSPGIHHPVSGGEGSCPFRITAGWFLVVARGKAGLHHLSTHVPLPCVLFVSLCSYNTIFLFLFACVAYGMGSCATGQTARLPIVADAADAQVR